MLARQGCVQVAQILYVRQKEHSCRDEKAAIGKCLPALADSFARGSASENSGIRCKNSARNGTAARVLRLPHHRKAASVLR